MSELQAIGCKCARLSEDCKFRRSKDHATTCSWHFYWTLPSPIESQLFVGTRTGRTGCWLQINLRSRLRNKSVEVHQEFRTLTNHFRGTQRIYCNLIKGKSKTYQHATSWTQLETLGYQPIMPKNLPPGACFVEATILTLSESAPSLTTDADTESVRQIAPVHFRIGETFELNQLKSAPSQLLLLFSGPDRLQTCCIHLDRSISYIFFPSAG